MKVRKILARMLLCVFLFSGCGKQQERALPLVTGVEVTCSHRGQTLQRQYSNPDKIHRMLYYLRKGQTVGYARANPERILGDSSCVSLTLSTGERRVYRLRADRYLSVDCRRWKNVDPAWGRRLYYMLLLIPSDPVANSAGG